MSVNVFSQKKLQKNIKIMNDTTEQANFEPKVLKSSSDSVFKDSTIVEAKTIKIADNELDDNVKYMAQDSIVYDIPNKTVYLYGRATIKYQEMDMAAGFIKYNWDSSEVYAKATYDDSLGAMKRVEFKDGNGEYVANEAKFNFKTKKGRSVGLVTKEMEGYLHGDQVKVIDSNTMYIKNARYTTCDLDDPHFYVEIGKAKVIKDKIIVGKPADVVIAGVRTPLFLPFAMLPSIKSKGTGLLMPTYGQSTELGFFLNNIGYYWKINDQVALTTTADVYTLGSWGLHTNLAYRKIYKFSGNLNFNINQQRGGSQYERFNPNRQKPPLNFGVQWQMNLDPKKNVQQQF
jgi:lipopolysaccharide assembly outer membrane protein LptD (OstA)